ncbi:MAG: hypothetical protein ABFD10_03215 [Prolixibacteraceae bacterium]
MLTFVLKYEGIDLAVLHKLFEKIGPEEITALVSSEPTGQYSREIWLLYEWLMDSRIEIPDLTVGNYVDLADPNLQYTGEAISSKRHRIRNNLPGVREFCPMIRKTPLLAELVRNSNQNFLSQKPASDTHNLFCCRDRMRNQTMSPLPDKARAWL